jgi:hypothetical protein
MNRTSDLEYRRSAIVVVIRSFMIFLKQMLPKSLYDHIYDFGFDFYRKMLRLSYYVNLLQSRLSGDREAYLKRTAVLKVMSYSLVGSSGLEATYDVTCDTEIKKLPGSFVECGVAQGGSAALMSLVSAQFGNRRMIWLFDSFEGLPDPTDDDFVENSTGLHIRALPKGSCLGTQEQVETLLFDRMKFDRQKIALIKGWFQDTLPLYRERVGKIAVLRIDADWYESVKCCLDNFYDNVAGGGYIVVDDYGSCFGAKKAVDEFLQKRKLQVALIPDGRGGCHFVKPS